MRAHRARFGVGVVLGPREPITTVRGNCASCDEIELSAAVAPPDVGVPFDDDGCVPSIEKDAASMRLGETSPPSGVRKKNEFTAREWRNSIHFTNLMDQPCFSEWPFAVQRAKGDEFVEAIERVSPELRMSRWGSRFKSFHGVT